MRRERGRNQGMTKRRVDGQKRGNEEGGLWEKEREER